VHGCLRFCGRGTLFFLSAQSSLPSIAPTVPNIDKVEHFGVYGLLGILVVDAVRRSTTLALPKAALMAILFIAVFAAYESRRSQKANR
jgi:VanZ family protein